ncbi:hypothetical protein ACFVXG_30730 [Kitasatospora sp. NPDC058162]|uniref:hypothetical protein n=1 Tax=Kitasatospora sp. NPDC058162 TaxID=3346362 RepID=UPI0036D94D68
MFYYKQFFAVFGLVPEQAGVSQTPIVVNSAALGIILALIATWAAVGTAIYVSVVRGLLADNGCALPWVWAAVAGGPLLVLAVAVYAAFGLEFLAALATGYLLATVPYLITRLQSRGLQRAIVLAVLSAFVVSAFWGLGVLGERDGRALADGRPLSFAARFVGVSAGLVALTNSSPTTSPPPKDVVVLLGIADGSYIVYDPSARTILRIPTSTVIAHLGPLL